MKEILDNHRSLSILNEISKGEEMTQRDLGQRVGMAVGLVNTYLKHLVSKGYIKISGIPPKRFKYYLTPKGFLEKSKLTYKLIQNYTAVFQEARRDYSVFFHNLSEEGVKGVYFAGVDEVAEIAYLSLQEEGIEFLGALDGEKTGEKFFGYTVAGMDELPGLPESTAVVITSYNRKDEIYSELTRCSVSDERIYCLHLVAGRRGGHKS